MIGPVFEVIEARAARQFPELIARSRADWVVLSLGEARFLPGGLDLVKREATGPEWAVWFSSEAADLSFERLCTVLEPPPGEALVFRREALAAVRFTATLDALAPWATFLELAERGPVRALDEDVATRPRDLDVARTLAALLLHAERLGGALSDAHRVALAALACRRTGDDEMRRGGLGFVHRVARSQPRLLSASDQQRLARALSR